MLSLNHFQLVQSFNNSIFRFLNIKYHTNITFQCKLFDDLFNPNLLLSNSLTIHSTFSCFVYLINIFNYYTLHSLCHTLLCFSKCKYSYSFVVSTETSFTRIWYVIVIDQNGVNVTITYTLFNKYEKCNVTTS